MTSEEAFDKARSILYKAYWKDIKDIVDELIDKMEKGEIEDRDALEEYIIDWAAGTWWTTYTGPSIALLLVSDNDKEVFEYDSEIDDSGDGIYRKMAVPAMREDIVQRLLRMKTTGSWDDLDDVFEFYSPEEDDEDED